MPDRGAFLLDVEAVGRRFERSWSARSGEKWSPENRTRGQSAVTALIVNDYYGGRILKTKVDGAWHFYNAIDGQRVDFTAAQFSAPITNDDLPSSRAEAFASTTAEQYAALTEAFLRAG